MTITVGWHDPSHTIVRYDMSTEWNWNELREAFTQALSMGSTKPYPVHVIVDMRHITLPPSHMLNHIPAFVNRQPNNTGIVVTVTQLRVVHVLMKVAKNLYPRAMANYHLCSTILEAEDLIATAQLVHS